MQFEATVGCVKNLYILGMSLEMLQQIVYKAGQEFSIYKEILYDERH